jgi:hypothetical protein
MNKHRYGVCFPIASLLVTIAAHASCAEPDHLVADRYGVRTIERPAFWMASAHKAHMLFQDGGSSIALPDGSALWTFGDTFYGHGTNKDSSPKCDGAVSSTVCRVTMTPKGPAVEYLTNADGRVDFLLPLHSSESWSRHRVWPMGGVHVGGVTYLYYTRVVLKQENVFGFAPDGAGLATAKGDSWKFKRVLMPHGDPPLPVEPVCAVACKADLYLYYIQKTGKMDSALFLARVPAARAHKPSAYRFWTGDADRFSKSKKDSVPVVKDIWGQASVAWNSHLKRYVMLHVGGVFNNPRSVYVRTSATCWGPWSKPTRVMALPGRLGPGFEGLIYCAYLHPELFREKGRVMLFTYCTVQKLGNPKLMEIELRDERGKDRP